jgi:hypothetical protein
MSIWKHFLLIKVWQARLITSLSQRITKTTELFTVVKAFYLAIAVPLPSFPVARPWINRSSTRFVVIRISDCAIDEIFWGIVL